MSQCMIWMMGLLWMPLDWDRVRSAYPMAVEDRDLCASLIQELSGHPDRETGDRALQLAYQGGFQTIWAQHVLNPIAKLRTFNQGREQIEKAVTMDPDSPEIRYIRLSVQQNAPRFLGYKGSIKKDTEFLRQNQGRISSNLVKNNVLRLIGETI